MSTKKKAVVSRRQLNKRISKAVNTYFSNLTNAPQTANIAVQQHNVLLSDSDQQASSSRNQHVAVDLQQPFFSGQNTTMEIEESVSSNESCADSEIVVGVDSEDDLSEIDEQTLKENIRNWSIENKIPIKSLSQLLKILKPYHPELPLDGRTLLKTPRCTEVKNLANGEYSHLGILNGLLNRMAANSQDPSLKSTDKIQIDINIDGISLYNSSVSESWPILGRMVLATNDQPFLIGIYCGKGKPDPIDNYLADFIQEVINLTDTGFQFEGKQYSFEIRSFLCDAPARAYLKQIVGHNGREGCERCVQEGVYTENCMTFVNCESILRTNDSFINKDHPNHHKGPSPLECLNVKFITQFPLDPMHLIYLGVVRRLIFSWVGNIKKSAARLRARDIRELTRKLLDVEKHITSEFSRKCRGLTELKKWKATEYRLFILYVGPVVLKNILPTAVYKHFMLLHCATVILSSDVMCTQLLTYARQLLVTFVKTARTYYGNTVLVYNVHNLLHICDDVEKYGCLEQFSCFPFENSLGAIKKLIRTPNNPLQQIVRRSSEIEAAGLVYEGKKTNEKIMLQQQHYAGPMLLAKENSIQYKKMCFENFELSTKSPNNVCKLTNGNVAVLRNIIQHNKEIEVLVQEYKENDDFFTYPCNSSNLGIHKVKGLSEIKVYSSSMIKSKCLLLPLSNRKKVAMPLLHLQ